MLGIVTETWLANGQALDQDVQDLAGGAGLGLIHKNRPANAMGVAHGGVAVIYKKSECSVIEVDLPNPDGYEVLVTAASIPGYSRKLLVVACYVPPNYPVGRGRGCLSHIEDVVLELKRRYRDPFILVGGDFNQWQVQDALEGFPDIREAPVGPTRKDRCLDRIFSNFGRSIIEAGSVPPLETLSLIHI